MIMRFLMSLEALDEGTATFICRPEGRTTEPPLATLTITRAAWNDLPAEERSFRLIEMKGTD